MIGSAPSITFLTPTLNPDSDALRRTFDAISELRRVRTVEHIVIDGGSGEDTKRLVIAQIGVQLIEARGANISEALNHGWKAAKGSYVMVMNAGDVPLPGVSAAISALDSVEAGVGVFPVAGTADGPPLKPIWRGDVLRSRWIHAGMLARRELLTSVGGYGRRFQFAMDWDWLSRAEHSGVPIVFQPASPPVVAIEPFGLSRERVMSSAGEFADVVRRDCHSKVMRIRVISRRLPGWCRGFLS